METNEVISTVTNTVSNTVTNVEDDTEFNMGSDLDSDVESIMNSDMEMNEETGDEMDSDEVQVLTDKTDSSGVSSNSSLSYLHLKKKLGPFYRPPLSYACLIYLAFKNSSSPRLRVTQVYTFITKYFPYYSATAPQGWKNSIRHNLSMNRNFSKISHHLDKNVKYERFCSWTLNPDRLQRMDREMRLQMKKYWNFVGSKCMRSPKILAYVVEGTVNSKDNKDSPPVPLVCETLPGKPLYLNDVDLKFTTLEVNDKRLGVVLYSKTVPLPPDFYSKEYSIDAVVPT